MDKQDLIDELNNLSANDLEEVLRKTDLLIHYGVNHHSSQLSFGCVPIYAASAYGSAPCTEPYEQIEIYLLSVGQNKIKVWQELRKILDLSVLEMKKFTDNLPKKICTISAYDKQKIQKIKNTFEKLGAEIYLKEIESW